MSYSASAIIMLAAGVGVPILAALNAALGQFLGSPVAAVTILLFVAFFTTIIIFFSSSGFSIDKLVDAPRHLFFGGLFMVFYILSITSIAPNFGVGNAIFFVLLGQLLSAAVIDHLSLFGSNGAPLSLSRVCGIGVMAIGIWITQQT
ncbi:MAG: DMT family transporter [Pseudomonadota bacterium]|nr:DMT family transporter [Pseudomonadota bacterium]